MKPTLRSVDTRHGELVYTMMGEGKPFLLLHGNTMTAASQEKLARRFTDEYQVFSVDLLGHGSSGRPEYLFSTDYFNIQGQALADMLTLLFPDERVPLFGMSAGGVSALNAACAAPERIQALILDSVFVYVGEDTVAAHRHNIDALSEAWHMYMRKQHGDEWWPQLNEGLLATVEQLQTSGVSVAPCLEEIHVPTLVFQGGQDPFSAEVQGRTIEASIPRSRLVYDPDGGHIFAWRDPDAFRQMVGEFLQEVEQA
jgi:pimeloyl-ACP methyl ester carboxylesterase